MTEFSPTHHALLFAWISKAAVERAGPGRGEDAVRRAARRYGEQRGRRMALRATGAGDPLTMASFVAYGEWQAAEGQMEQERIVSGPDLRQVVHRCPWYSAWEAEELVAFGRFYCAEIDHALIRGFNPSLRLEVVANRPNDGVACEFGYRDAMRGGDRLAAKRRVMPWDYHLGHLVGTLRQVLVAELGPVGYEAVEAGLGRFGARYCQDAERRIRSFENTDFDTLHPG